MNSSPIVPFRVPPTALLSPLVTRGNLQFDEGAGVLELEYWRALRPLPFLRLPATRLQIPADRIAGFEVRTGWIPFRDRMCRLLARSFDSFPRLARGSVDLRIPFSFRGEIRRIAVELNYRAALVEAEVPENV